jgi:hypothetical protein
VNRRSDGNELPSGHGFDLRARCVRRAGGVRRVRRPVIAAAAFAALLPVAGCSLVGDAFEDRDPHGCRIDGVEYDRFARSPNPEHEGCWWCDGDEDESGWVSAPPGTPCDCPNEGGGVNCDCNGEGRCLGTEVCNGEDDDGDKPAIPDPTDPFAGIDEDFPCVKGQMVECTTPLGCVRAVECTDACQYPTCPNEVGHDECADGTAVPCTTSCGTSGTGLCTHCALPTGGACIAVEVCNGVDDDCNGATDNGFPCAQGTIGSCPVSCGSGARTCSSSCAWGPCLPPAEICNGLDDDCDTAPDEDFACVAGTSLGCTTPCGAAGTTRCSDLCQIPAGTACLDPVGTECVRGDTRSCADECGTVGTERCGETCAWGGCEAPARAELRHFSIPPIGSTYASIFAAVGACENTGDPDPVLDYLTLCARVDEYVVVRNRACSSLAGAFACCFRGSGHRQTFDLRDFNCGEGVGGVTCLESGGVVCRREWAERCDMPGGCSFVGGAVSLYWSRGCF